MTHNGTKLKERIKDSTIESQDKIVNEVASKQVVKMFCVALSMHTYTIKENRIVQAFKTTFVENEWWIWNLNAAVYIQLVLGPVQSKSPIIL